LEVQAEKVYNSNSEQQTRNLWGVAPAFGRIFRFVGGQSTQYSTIFTNV